MSVWWKKGTAHGGGSEAWPHGSGEASTAGPARVVPVEHASAVKPEAKASRLRMGLLLAASALGGGVAVVLYNRRLLAKMREPRSPAPRTDSGSWDDDA